MGLVSKTRPCRKWGWKGSILNGLKCLDEGLDFFQWEMESNWWVLNGEGTWSHPSLERSWCNPCGWMWGRTRGEEYSWGTAEHWSLGFLFCSTDMRLGSIFPVSDDIAQLSQSGATGLFWLRTVSKVCRSLRAKCAENYFMMSFLPQQPWSPHVEETVGQDERNLHPWVREVSRKATQSRIPTSNFSWGKNEILLY